MHPKPIFDNLTHFENESSVPAHVLVQANEANLAIESDFKVCRDFLTCYKGSQDTFNAYRREVERLLQWGWWHERKTLKEITRKDIESYIEFCQSPPEDWITTRVFPRFTGKMVRKPNEKWRPFVNQNDTTKIKYQLSNKALEVMIAALSSFFNFLTLESYCEVNPVLQLRQKSKYIQKVHGKSTVRRLSELQWAYVIDCARQKADSESAYERTLFILSALYGMYLRVSELVASERWTPQMNHFRRDKDGNWWFTTLGKGNKIRDITVSDAMLAALKRYRNYLGLPPYPMAQEHTPLILDHSGKEPIRSTRHIRRLVQSAFDAAAEQLRSDGLNDEALQLSEATVHWLRHTGISDDVKSRPREHVRDDAGHSSSAITDKYIDIELRERHASAKKKVIIPDE